MKLAEAQRLMRTANVGGAPGVLVSGMVWVAAGSVWFRLDVARGFVVLFFGGMAIVPVALLIARAVFRAPKPPEKNPFDRLALESTAPLFAGLLISYALLGLEPSLVFPIMAITIGARYFSFRTIYGEFTYWVLAATMVAIGGTALLGLVTWPINVAITIGAVEIVFAAALLVRLKAFERK